jgi:arginase
MTRKLAVLDAPSSLGLGPAESDAVPCGRRRCYAMRQREFVARLGARDVGQVEPPAYAAGPDPCEPCGGESMRVFTRALAERVREIVESRQFPVVLGGECSVLLGNMLGLRSLGRYGLVFVDGHDELSCAHELEEHRGLLTAAGLDLALATGNGPDALTNLLGLRPYVDERHVVLLGMAGGRAAAERAVRHLERLSLDGFWIHLDADVLDQSVLAASGEGDPYAELTAALRVFLASDKAVGMELTIDDAELDPEGVYGDRLIDSVVRAFDREG